MHARTCVYVVYVVYVCVWYMYIQMHKWTSTLDISCCECILLRRLNILRARIHLHSEDNL